METAPPVHQQGMEAKRRNSPSAANGVAQPAWSHEDWCDPLMGPET